MYRFNTGGSGGTSRPDPEGGARALAIALGVGYEAALHELETARALALNGWAQFDRTGLSLVVFDDVMRRYGWVWSAAPRFPDRRARVRDLPCAQIVIARQAQHFVAVVHGVSNDTMDCTAKMVYGYWHRSTGFRARVPSQDRRVSKHGNGFLNY